MYSGTGSLRRNTAVPSSPVFCCKYHGRGALTKDTRTGLPAMAVPFLASIRCTTSSVAHNLGGPSKNRRKPVTPSRDRRECVLAISDNPQYTSRYLCPVHCCVTTAMPLNPAGETGPRGRMGCTRSGTPRPEPPKPPEAETTQVLKPQPSPGLPGRERPQPA